MADDAAMKCAIDLADKALYPPERDTYIPALAAIIRTHFPADSHVKELQRRVAELEADNKNVSFNNGELLQICEKHMQRIRELEAERDSYAQQFLTADSAIKIVLEELNDTRKERDALRARIAAADKIEKEVSREEDDPDFANGANFMRDEFRAALGFSDEVQP